MIDPIPRKDAELPPPAGYVTKGHYDALAAERDALKAENERLRVWEGFGQAVVGEWPSDDIDGADLFDLSLKFGLIEEVPGGYDPDQHIDAHGDAPEAGDPWYEWAFPKRRADKPAPDPVAQTATAVSILLENTIKPLMAERDNLVAERDALKAENERLRADKPAPDPVAQAARVLAENTPNPVFDRLKPALMGEYMVSVYQMDSDGNEVPVNIIIPWNKTKEIIRDAICALAKEDQTDELEKLSAVSDDALKAAYEDAKRKAFIAHLARKFQVTPGIMEIRLDQLGYLKPPTEGDE